ncbi:hypothetical protein SAMN04488062_105231 [Flavobacterium omnivorum]|uniref:Uncharacterized protein n=1 Tax=Flavobacterium omnivorum TaxID=178355 RepID=A0A1G8B195_9FLAO|nr:hypothetical protein SAMN04488062_105231 [Flavobacterium omnivorum]
MSSPFFENPIPIGLGFFVIYHILDCGRF